MVLAGNCSGIRVAMGILSDIRGATSTWKWTSVKDLTFLETKKLVQTHSVAINYGESAPVVNINPDASLTSAGTMISQGEDLKMASIVAFWSGKFNNAQQNYPVHECELLAIVETLKQFCHLLLGNCFRVFTDHKPLELLLQQRNLSA